MVTESLQKDEENKSTRLAKSRILRQEETDVDPWSYHRFIATALLVFPLLIFGATLITLGFITGNWIMLGIGFVTFLVSVICAIIVRLCRRKRPPIQSEIALRNHRNLSVPSICEEARLSLTSSRKTSSLQYLRPLSSDDVRRVSTSSSCSMYRFHTGRTTADSENNRSGLFVRENRLSVSSHLSMASAVDLRHWKPGSSEEFMINDSPPSPVTRLDTPSIVINNNQIDKLDSHGVSADDLSSDVHETEL